MNEHPEISKNNRLYNPPQNRSSKIFHEIDFPGSSQLDLTDGCEVPPPVVSRRFGSRQTRCTSTWQTHTRREWLHCRRARGAQEQISPKDQPTTCQRFRSVR